MNLPKQEWLQAWHVNPSANRDYDLIDGLRGIAILLVVCCHLVYNINPLSSLPTRFIGALMGAGGFGVMLFFTLSGFLISWPFWKRKVKGTAAAVPPGYGWRRFWKIYPPLAFSVMVLTPAYILILHDRSFVYPALQWLVGLPLVRPVNGGLNPVMWSLIVEMHFYILLPVLFLCLKRVSAKTCLWMIPALMFVVPVCWRWNNTANGIFFSLHPDIKVHFPALLDNFALGVLIAGLENMGMVKKSWVKFGDLGFILLALVLLAVPCLTLFTAYDELARFEIIGWGVRISSAFLLCYIANPQHPRSRMLSNPWLRWCGIISYEWYLFHQPLIHWTHAWFGPAQGRLLQYGGVSVLSAATSLLVAAAVYRYFSLPILKYGRGRNSAAKVRPLERAKIGQEQEPLKGT